MVKNIENFDKARYKKFAKTFVDIYIQRGADSAGEYTLAQLPTEEQRIEARGFVRDEFESRGYTFNI